MSSNLKISLDIVIPSFRADVKVLESIRMLSFPDNLVRNIIVILDDLHIHCQRNWSTGTHHLTFSL